MLIHSLFDKIQNTHNIILKTEQTTIVYAQWDRRTLYVIKHHMITTDVILK